MEVAAGGGDDKSRCRRTGNRGVWRCKSQAVSGKILCEKHCVEYERRKEKKKMEKLNKLGDQENGGGSNSGDVVGNRMATGTEKTRVFDGVGTSEGGGGVIPGESGGEGVGVVKEKEIERPSGSEIGKELELKQVISDVSREGGGSYREKAIERPSGSEIGKELELMQVISDVNHEGGGTSREKEKDRPSGSEIGKQLELMQVISDVSHEGGGTSRENKIGRPMGLKNREKLTVENDVEAMQMGGGKKRGRPKGSKNKKKFIVSNDVEAMQMGSDVRGGGGIVVSGKKIGSPTDSEKHVKIAAENEVVAVKVGDVSSEHGDEVDGKNVVAMPLGDVNSEHGYEVVVKEEDVKIAVAVPVGDVNSEFDEGIVANKDDGVVKIVGVGGRGEVLGTAGSVQPVGNGDNSQGNFGVALNEDVVINLGIGESGGIPEFGSLGSQGGDIIAKSTSEIGIPEGSAVNEVTIVKSKGGRPKGSKNKKVDAQVGIPSDSQDIKKNEVDGGSGAVERKGKRGRPKGSKNKTIKGEKEPGKDL